MGARVVVTGNRADSPVLATSATPFPGTNTGFRVPFNQLKLPGCFHHRRRGETRTGDDILDADRAAALPDAGQFEVATRRRPQEPENGRLRNQRRLFNQRLL